MQDQAILEELEAAAGQLGVKVSYEALKATIGVGGLCRVRGEYRMIIDKRSQVGERVATLASGLARVPAMTSALSGEQSQVQLSPPVRDLVLHYARRAASS